MLLIHTADWHAGLTLNRHPMDEGLKHALDEVAEYAISEKADVVLVSGDIFDSPRPPGPSQEMVFEFFLRLYKADIPAVVIAGNHDSLGQWTALKPLLNLANVSVFAKLSVNAIKVIETKSGPLEVAAVPWPTERLLAPLVNSEDWDHDQQKMTWASRVGRIIELLCNKMNSKGPRVLLGHLMVNGSMTSCSERPMSISDTYAVPGEVFPADLNYVALGHVHKPQAAGAPTKTCYSGALRPMDFGEAGEERGFYRVVVEPGQHTETDFIPIEPKIPLTVVQTTLEELDEAIEEHRETPGYMKFIVDVPSAEVGLADRVRNELPGAIIVKSVPRGKGKESTKTEVQLIDPLETFREYYQKEYGGEELPEALERAFKDIYEEASSR